MELSTQMSQYAIDGSVRIYRYLFLCAFLLLVMGHLAYSVDLGALHGHHERYYDHVKVMLKTINRYVHSIMVNKLI